MRGAILGFIEKGAPWKLAPMSPGTLKLPEHMAKHPWGKIPVMEDGDFSLYETQAILRYIDRILPDPPLTPSDPRAEARMEARPSMQATTWEKVAARAAG